jgi:hypothetical protein
MKVTLQSTDRVVELNGTAARVWEGTTESGIRCYAAIPLIAAHRDDDNSEFERDLREVTPASDDAIRVFPSRLVT